MARGIYIRTRYIGASIPAFKVALEAFNSPTNPYRQESALILMVNAIELLSKAVLLKMGKNIQEGKSGKTIPVEKAINRLLHIKEIEQIEHESVQQLISLRNEASHAYLGKIEPDLILFLLFSAYKLFQKLLNKHFKAYSEIFSENYLSISTNQNKTYADSIIGLFKSKRDSDRRILYLLERGVRYEGKNYISQETFEKELKKNKGKRLENKGALGSFVSRADLLRVIFVQAPKHYSVDLTLGRNRRDKSILPVQVITRLQCDRNTAEIAALTGLRPYDVQKFIRDNKIKGNGDLHQEIPNGKSPPLHRYSEKLVDLIKKSRKTNPNY